MKKTPRIADKAPLKAVTKANPPKAKKLSRAALETQLELALDSLEKIIELEKKAQLAGFAYRDKYFALRDKIEFGLTIWERLAILFGVLTLED